MTIEFEPEFHDALLRDLAASRGLEARLNALVAAREEDGLDSFEALLDAAESLELVSDLEERFADVLAPLEALEIERVGVSDSHADMPTLRRWETLARVWVPVQDAAQLAGRLVALLNEDPDRRVVTLPVGLGGFGGCACGEELPEDEPVGPLFARG